MPGKIEICPAQDCTGCLACFNACGVSAVEISQDSEGFIRPYIAEEKCVNCRRCYKVCPALNPYRVDRTYQKKVYAAWSSDASVRRSSSSGGVFTELSKVVLASGGVVFGAKFDDNLNLVHSYVETFEDMKHLRGSKYVQSFMGDSFKKVREFLNEGRGVLFSGTSCQAAGLRTYLGKNYDKLLVVDILCHGVPSPLIFEEYKKYLEKMHADSLAFYSFRDKKWSWLHYNSMYFFKTSPKRHYGTWEDDPWMRGFLRDYFLRPCCHTCKYANLDRVGDITLADYWGYPAPKDPIFKNNDKGISMVMANTFKGFEAFSKIKDSLICWDTGIEPAVKGNKSFREPSPPSDRRDDFWKDYKSGTPFEDIVSKYMYPESKPRLLRILYSERIPKSVYHIALFAARFRNRVKSAARKIFS